MSHSNMTVNSHVTIHSHMTTNSHTTVHTGPARFPVLFFMAQCPLFYQQTFKKHCCKVLLREIEIVKGKYFPTVTAKYAFHFVRLHIIDSYKKTTHKACNTNANFCHFIKDVNVNNPRLSPQMFQVKTTHQDDANAKKNFIKLLSTAM